MMCFIVIASIFKVLVAHSNSNRFPPPPPPPQLLGNVTEQNENLTGCISREVFRMLYL